MRIDDKQTEDQEPIYAYVSDDPLFRSLTLQEVNESRQYARDNDPPHLDRWYIYHPVCRDEWMKRGIQPPFTGEGV